MTRSGTWSYHRGNAADDHQAAVVGGVPVEFDAAEGLGALLIANIE